MYKLIYNLIYRRLIYKQVQTRLNSDVSYDGYINEKRKSRHMNKMRRSSHWRCSLIKGVLRNFAKFTGKHLCQSLFFRDLQLY